VAGTADQIGVRAEAIAVEQSVEMPVAAITDRTVLEEIVGRVEDIRDLGNGVFEVHVGLAAATTGLEPGQLLNMLFGNTSFHSDVVLHDAIFPDELPPHVVCEQSEPVQSAVAHLPAQARVLIMSFSHAEDLDIVAACLLRQRAQADLRFIGLIGSQTKWATFRKRLQARGFTDAELAQVTSPIGVPGIPGKSPEVIAVAVAAQLLQLGD